MRIVHPDTEEPATLLRVTGFLSLLLEDATLFLVGG